MRLACRGRRQGQPLRRTRQPQQRPAEGCSATAVDLGHPRAHLPDQRGRQITFLLHATGRNDRRVRHTRRLRPAHHRHGPGALCRGDRLLVPAQAGRAREPDRRVRTLSHEGRHDDGGARGRRSGAGLQPHGAAASLLHRRRRRGRELQRVHARRRLGLQPRVAEPDEVPPRGRHLRRGLVRARGRHRAARAGDHRRAVELPDRGDRRQRARLPPARPRLRQPRRLPDEQRHALRLRPWTRQRRQRSPR